MFMLVGDRHVHALNGALDNPAVDVLLGISLIAQSIRSIFPNPCKTVT